MRTLLLLAGALMMAAMAWHSTIAAAQTGVGISRGEIAVEEELARGGRYELPGITVTNTGTQPARYEVVISSIQDQPELLPESGWFRFQPQAFDLAPGQSQVVSTSLNVGAGAEPGDYFSLIEAHPIQGEDGVTVGLAAATKLSFHVKPSGTLELWRLRIAQFFADNSPFSIVLPPTLAGLLVIYLLSRRFRLHTKGGAGL